MHRSDVSRKYPGRFTRSKVKVNRMVALSLFIAAALLFVVFPQAGLAQHDPGVRSGPPGAGGPVPGLTANELAMFREGIKRANQLEAVCDTCGDLIPGADNGQDPLLQTLTNSSGLGARFNGDQCTICHAQPAIGGSGGFVVPNPQDPPSQFRKPENPMFDLMPHRKGATNYVPSFITQYGPIREVRFQKRPDGTPDGGVHQLFTVVGRSDVGGPGCTNAALPPTDFETQLRNNNLSFRIPLQLFGLGLIDEIQDSEILGLHNATAAQRAALGIQGVPNRSGNDGTITRFGWKAQNKSITMFAGEAYNVEMGVTNELFPQATDETPACNVNKSEPNDITRMDATDARNQGFNNPLHEIADWLQFTLMMRFFDAPQPVAFSASATRGQQLFGTVGCALCHTPQMITAPQSETNALQGKTANLYSDLMVHHMGSGLADNITQGVAQGDMFRSTPLWGVGQRTFLLHDGRTSDLLQAILAHSSSGSGGNGNDNSQGNENGGGGGGYPASEANGVISAFKALRTSDQQAILDFLRSL
jgi:Di-haem oxidoreductase, putative peroxidase